MKINMHNYEIKKNEGLSLVEVLVYIAILFIVSTALVAILTSVLRTFSNLEAYEDITHSSTVALERITREIRKAQAVNLGDSVLSSHPGTLSLDTTDTAGLPATITIRLEGGNIVLQEGILASAPLTSDHVTISNLVFTHIQGTNTEAVRIALTAQRTTKGVVVSKNFSTFVVLDGS